MEVLAEIMEQNKAVVLLFRSDEITPESLQLRSKVIQKALKAASEFCPKVKTVESFVDPTEIIYPPQTEATSGKTQPGEAASTRFISKSASELSQHQA